ncbi:hypothetical protein MHYP_G00224420 [Metynnis hypsauchen]
MELRNVWWSLCGSAGVLYPVCNSFKPFSVLLTARDALLLTRRDGAVLKISEVCRLCGAHSGPPHVQKLKLDSSLRGETSTEGSPPPGSSASPSSAVH